MFKSREDKFFGVEFRPVKIVLQVRAFPIPSVQWTFNGQKLVGKNFKSHISPSGAVTLELCHMTEADVGDYKVSAENAEGMAVRKIYLDLAGKFS